MYRPPSANAGDGYTKQPNNERPVEDVGKRRHCDPSEDFSRRGLDVPIEFQDLTFVAEPCDNKFFT